MAYFPNSSAGDVLEQQCETCIHGVNNELLCPVYYVQAEYNYSQLGAGNEFLQSCLLALIDKAGTCKMKAVLLKAGVVFDVSDRDQMELGI